MPPVRLIALAVAALTVIAACTGASASPTASLPAATVRATASVASTPTLAPTLSKVAKVTMGDNYYAPDEITIGVGGTVSWEIVAGDAKHDIVADDGSFRSNSPMNRGDIFSFTFTKPGAYAYICSFHTAEHMMGKVVVK